MVFSNTWILPLKVFFISTGVLSMALLFKTSVPFVIDFSTSKAPVIWSSFVSWLKPPYLYLIINGIIIGIAASSRFCQNDDASSSTESSSSSALPTPSPGVEYEMKAKSDFGSVVYEQQQPVMDVEEEEETKAPIVEEKSVAVSEAVEVGCAGDAIWTPPKRTESSDILTELNLTMEKPLVSARFGHRKPVKSSPEGGKALRVTKPKRHDTLENTWKAITEGRAMPLTRHLKKSDTWENHGRHINVDPSPAVKKAETFNDRTVKNSETFKDRTNYQLPPVNSNDNSSPASGGKLRKEPSLSQDELNRRVEAFIKKFNEEMRLQRQESLRQYQEMVGSGV